MSTLLEKRQLAAIKNLRKRKVDAENYIKAHTAKLEEKLAPYRNELEVVERMITEFEAANPELPVQPAGKDGNGDAAEAA